MHDVHYVDSATVVAVGDYGTVMRSVDGGNHWTYDETGAQRNLLALHCFDPANSVATGDSGLVLYTKDGGESWHEANSVTDVPLTGIAFPTRTTGYACGFRGVIARTLDGGESWSMLSTGSSVNLSDIHFITPGHGVAIGDSGTILRTNDSGATWRRIETGVTARLSAVSFADDRHGTIVGVGGFVTTTSDSGKSWTQISGVTPTINFLDVCIEDSLHAVATGYLPSAVATIVRTSDGGATWTESKAGIPSTRYLFPVRLSMTNKRYGIVVGNFGSMFQTGDSGMSWQVKSYASLGLTGLFVNTLTSIAFASSETGVIAGYDGDITPLLRTTDAGLTWRLQRQVTSGRFVDPYFFDSTNGIIGVTGTREMYHTSDAGATWTRFVSNRDPQRDGAYSMWFLNNDHGYLAFDSLVYHTTDHGATWEGGIIPLSRLMQNVRFVTPQVGFAHGTYWPDLTKQWNVKVFRTDDGGETWRTIYDRYGFGAAVNGIHFIDETHGFLVTGIDTGGSAPLHGMIYRTQDGGVTWDSLDVNDGVPRDIQFFNELNGMIVGRNGLILVTSNGGQTWNREYISPGHGIDSLMLLLRIGLLPDRKTVMAVGYGVMIHKEFDHTLSEAPPVEESRRLSLSAIELRITPNPTTDDHQTITLRGFQPRGNWRLEVFDVLGRPMADLTDALHANGSLSVDLVTHGWANGVYLIRLSSDMGTYSDRLVIQR